MLRKLLTLIADEAVNSPSESAIALGVSEAALDGMIEQLVSLGYLEDFGAKLENASCGGKKGSGCAGCPMSGGCHGAFGKPKGKLWTITRKGLASIGKKGD